MNHLNFILRFETEENMPYEDVVAGFQDLIDDGTVWHLQGTYQHAAQRLLESGDCQLPTE